MFDPPTAVQVFVFRHATAERVPACDPRSFQCEPPSVVSMTWDPTARHDTAVVQKMPLRVPAATGGVCGVQVLPPSVVLRMAAPGPAEDEPTAVQSRSLVQEMPVKFATVPGLVSRVHVVPPSEVAMMLGEPALN
jgi:hypothetical protein